MKPLHAVRPLLHVHAENRRHSRGDRLFVFPNDHPPPPHVHVRFQNLAVRLRITDAVPLDAAPDFRLPCAAPPHPPYPAPPDAALAAPVIHTRGAFPGHSLAGFRCRKTQPRGGTTGREKGPAPMAMPDFTLRQLLEAGVHFGHHTRRWNPRMAPLPLRRAQPGPHHRPAADRADARPRPARRARRHRRRRPRAVRRHQARRRRIRRRGRQALRPVLRQPPLARRHADQLEDHHRLDQAPAPDRGPARRRHRAA